MRLKKITIFGFKSFADKTSLEFHPGITGIVGPNGCGKSNVSDAFRWVLGEQSAKSLRGHKMQDIIFAGTSHRRPLHLAEVSITLTEINGALPIEFEEITITRRLHRNGDSEYLLNGTQVRLKDLQALFFDSGIGKEAFSIFEQGKIDQVIHYTPLERRTIFEEAAGIVRFLHRKREALRKLEQTDLNLSRVEDILREVSQRIAVLEQQAASAIAYKERKALFELLEKQLMTTKWATGKQRLQQLASEETSLSERLEKLTAEISSARQELHQARIKAHDCEQAWKERSAEMYAKRNERDLFLRDRSHMAKRREELQHQIARWGQDLQALAVQNEKNTEEQGEQNDAHGELRSSLTELRSTLDEAQVRFDEKSQELEDTRRSQDESQKSRLALTQSHSSKQAEWKQLQARIEALNERLPPLEDKVSNLEQQKKETQDKQKIRADELKKLSDTIDTYKGQLDTLDNLYNEIKDSLATGQADGETLVKESATLQTRLHTLQELRSALDSFSPGCKRLLEDSAQPKNTLYGKITPLYELISPPPGQERAAAAALQPYGQTLVVATKEDLNLTLAYIKKHQLTDVTLFCAEDAPHSNLTHHFLDNLKIVNTLDEALSLHTPAWSNEGALIDHKRVLFYEPRREGNSFMREAEITSLQEQIDSLEHRKIQHSQQQRLHQERLSETQIKRTSLDKEMRTTEMKLVEVNYALLRHQADAKRIEDEFNILKAEQNKTREAIVESSLRCEDLASSVASLEKQLKLSETTSQHQSTLLDELFLIVKKEQANFENARKCWQEAYAKERQQQHSLEVLSLKKHEISQNIKKLHLEISQAKEALDSLCENNTDTTDQIETVQKLVLKLETSCQTLEKNTADAKQEAENLEKKLLSNEQNLKSIENDKHKLQVQASQLSTLQETLTSAYKEKYNDEFTPNSPLLEDIPQTEKQLKTLKQELDSTQNINMLAIEECSQDKQRSDFLSSQINDLKLSKNELAKVIQELDSQSRKLFEETFNAIRTNFQKNFAILFNGGEADLQFVDNDDLLEAGIEISAKPPGKQMRSISLLSGGEKCLTAMALLFAIFEVKPSPYCILDEIDAPLDDSNVERFLNVVKQFIDRCQFIIITHNKRTMAIADRLYGVSMQEKGVSKLLSMEFSNTYAVNA
ncbi:MAG: chromosome segregation protein SMC [Parachlamydiales bacterium]